MSAIIGAQVYGLKQEFEQNLEGTLEQIADMGFGRFEALAIPLEEQISLLPADIWSLEYLKRAAGVAGRRGVTMPTLHICAAIGAEDQPDRLIADGLLRIQEITGTTGFVFSGMFRDAEKAQLFAEHLSVISDYVKPQGCTVIFHNHDDECHDLEVGGERMRVLDYFFRLASPDIMLEMDIGWTALVCDAMQLAEQYKDRIVDLHCRDFYPAAFSGRYTRTEMPAELFAPVGLGKIPVREIMKTARSFPHFSGDYVVEQEKSAHSMLADLELSCRNMRKWLEEDS